MNKQMLKVSGLAVILGGVGWAQVTLRVSVDSSGMQGNDASQSPSISGDGRFVAFSSYATNLVPGDTNGFVDVFVRDLQTGAIERVSVSSSGVQGDEGSEFPSISSDGRFVAFQSDTSNLASGDTNGQRDILIRDRLAHTTELVSLSSTGIPANGISSYPSISADGRYVTFTSDASNLVPGDANLSDDVFVRDLQNGTTERVSVSSLGVEGNSNSFQCTISADGRYVAFASVANNLVAGDTNQSADVFIHDRQTGTTERVSVNSSGMQVGGYSNAPVISADGLHVAFHSISPDLVPVDTNSALDVFVHDLQSGATELSSVSSSGVQAIWGAAFPSISGDGRYVAFSSQSPNLVLGDTNNFTDVFVHDRVTGMTERSSVSSAGSEAIASSFLDPSSSVISNDGRYVVFMSHANNLVRGDTNAVSDTFMHDRNSTGFTSSCDAGVGSVIACPCANPPSGPGRGCDNSSTTGGAILSAAGVAYLSSDSLVFTASGEKPTALSIFSQGAAFVGTGIVFGQGVRCANVNLKRLYNKSAVGGVVSAPTGGDPAVHTRSAALGDPIAPGTSRFYYVYYRDPIVLGGCPASSTFNATQTGQVAWSP